MELICKNNIRIDKYLSIILQTFPNTKEPYHSKPSQNK